MSKSAPSLPWKICVAGGGAVEIHENRAPRGWLAVHATESLEAAESLRSAACSVARDGSGTWLASGTPIRVKGCGVVAHRAFRSGNLADLRAFGVRLRKIEALLLARRSAR